ncbi:hypothetical protein JXA47_14715 [Candidatus Sumerlaeota bacterium]|nr:hypothetical protein [Candidatus Sumerlaeota bacterium]
MRSFAVCAALVAASVFSTQSLGAQDSQFPTAFFSEDTVLAAFVNLREITGPALTDSINAIIDIPALQRGLSQEAAEELAQRHRQAITMAQAMSVVPQALAIQGVPYVTAIAMTSPPESGQGIRVFALAPVPPGIDAAWVQQTLVQLIPRMPQTRVVEQIADDDRIDQWIVACRSGMAMPPDIGWSPSRQERFHAAAVAIGTDQALFWAFVPNVQTRDTVMAMINAFSQGEELSNSDIAMRVEARTVAEVLTQLRWIGGSVRLGGNLLISVRAELSDPAHVGQLQSSWSVATGLLQQRASSADARRSSQDLPALTHSNTQVVNALISALQPQFSETGFRIDLTAQELRQLITMVVTLVSESMAEVASALMAGPMAILGGEQQPSP